MNANFETKSSNFKKIMFPFIEILLYTLIYEPPHEKTNNVVSEQVQHKSGCTVTEAG